MPEQDEHAIKLNLAQLCRLRFPRGSWKDRAQWFKTNQDIVHWTIAFWIDGWEWALDLSPEKSYDDPDWSKSEYIFMWICNSDPHRFLVAVKLYTVRDLLRFLDAFKVQYEFIPESELKPFDYTKYEL